MAKTLPNPREAAILAILVAGERFGREIRDAYEKRAKQKMPLGSLYTTMDRTEEAGFVTSRMGDPDPERGGNRRKYYKITAPGLKALNELQQMVGAPLGGIAHA